MQTSKLSRSNLNNVINQSQSSSLLPEIKVSGTANNAEKSTALEFEMLTMSQMVNEMFKTIDFGNFSGGFGADIWRSFLSRSIAEEIVGQKSIGIAGNIEDMLDAYKK
jgi:flagellar protein FlgJ